MDRKQKQVFGKTQTQIIFLVKPVFTALYSNYFYLMIIIYLQTVIKFQVNNDNYSQ